jgi:serine/threonine protein kinase
MHYYGSQDEFNVMVIDMLGPDLETLFCFCGKGDDEKIVRRRGDGDEEPEDKEDDDDDEEEEKKEFSLKTVCMLAIEMISRIEYVHSKGFIHRDIKPQNFLMGVGKKATTVYNIDFGLSKRYLDPKSGRHIVFKEKTSIAGTYMYLSMNAHMGRE